MTKSETLWYPPQTNFTHSRMAEFAKKVEHNHGFDWQSDSERLWQWSVEHRETFWRMIWEEFLVIGSAGDPTLFEGKTMLDDQFFPNGQLNFAENLLADADSSPAIIALREDGQRCVRSRTELADEVMRFAQFLRDRGVGPHDVVAAYMPNTSETVIAMLGAAAIGACFSSCSIDFGTQAVVDRLSQVKPKVFVAASSYQYAGKAIDRTESVKQILASLPTVQELILVPYNVDDPMPASMPESVRVSRWQDAVRGEPLTYFEKFPFAHPLYILFSSGTTGLPKPIMHGAGGTLLQHLKEHALHCDIRAGDRVFYFTTCGWMMWNWLVSVLAQRATIVLYEGNPAYPNSDRLWRIAQDERLSLMGISAKYIDAQRKSGLNISEQFSLSHLRMVCSTGSPLSEDGFKFIYEKVKSDVHLASISGGTDIVSCFALASPVKPVFAGALQMRGLGMNVAIWSDDGLPVVDQPGELVCDRSFPSMPIGFMNDPQRERYHSAYFEHFPDVWRHGDWAQLTSSGELVIHGRSDATLNPGGVRIGTAELYRIVEHFDIIKESLAVGHTVKDDDYIVLFVIMAEGISLTPEHCQALRNAIRAQASPRHVPTVIYPVKDFPRTRSGKISELAVRHVLQGRQTNNQNSLSNPEVLDVFASIKDEITAHISVNQKL